MSNYQEHASNFGQSAVHGVQGRDVTIGDINQIINNSSNDSYNLISTIVSEYKNKLIKLERTFKDRNRTNQKNLHKSLQNYYKSLRRRIEDFQEKIEEEEQEEEEQEEEKEEEDEDTSQLAKERNNGSLGWTELGTIAVIGAAIWMAHKDSGNHKEKENEEEREQDIEELRTDVGELKHLIHLVNDFLNLGSLELDIDETLDDESLLDLSSPAKRHVESLKDQYKDQQEKLKDFYQQESDKCRTERDTKIYRHLLKTSLDKDGYPLSSNNVNSINYWLGQFTLSEECIEEIEEEVIKPFCLKNLELYERAYRDKLSQEKFPLMANSVSDLRLLKDKLGLNSFDFLRTEVGAIEKEVAKSFYQENFREYQRIYRLKLEQNCLTLNSDDLVQLDKLQSSLGLKIFSFQDFDIKETEQQLIKLVYQENIQKYKQSYKQKLDQEGFPLSLTTINELNSLEKALCLGSFKFQDCPEPVSVKKELVKPFYQASLQSYNKEHKKKILQFGINFVQNNAAEIESLRRNLGLNYSYLESLGLQELFNLEEIKKIESEQIESIYREHIQSFEIEYKRKLDKEGFFLSYSTISELNHLEEFLGLGSLQFQDCPEPISIKEKLTKPFYEASLQNYSQEYKRKLYQFGLGLAENNTLEVDKLRNDLGLNSSHLNNLGLQNKFTLEDDLSVSEVKAKALFYSESLQCYAQEFSRNLESSSCFVEQINTIKESIQALGIRIEDIRVIEGLLQNNYAIEHLFCERESEISYWKLINFLAKHEWKNADVLTRDILLKLAGRNSKDSLNKEAIEKISAKDVYTLDRLWVVYSNGLFGFSIQKKIFECVDRKKQAFAELVGWSNKAGLLKGLFAWKAYNELDFSLNAPKGHLPVWRVKGKEIGVDDFSHLKIWGFKQNESEPELETFTTEGLSQFVSETNDSKSSASTVNILSQSFQKIFESINQFEIKNKVDKMGIDGFINQCAVLAATTGAVSGFGGFTTMIVGVPFDVLNNVLQQFRVTLGVIYHKKGVYNVSFGELITIVGVSIGVEVGATLTKSVMISIANKILVQLSTSVAGKAVPFLGAAIGGSVNYGFVRAIGAAVKRIDMSTYTFQSERSVNKLEG